MEFHKRRKPIALPALELNPVIEGIIQYSQNFSECGYASGMEPAEPSLVEMGKMEKGTL